MLATEKIISLYDCLAYWALVALTAQLSCRLSAVGQPDLPRPASCLLFTFALYSSPGFISPRIVQQSRHTCSVFTIQLLQTKLLPLNEPAFMEKGSRTTVLLFSNFVNTGNGTSFCDLIQDSVYSHEPLQWRNSQMMLLILFANQCILSINE